MADFINTIDVLGDEVVMDSLINRTITEFKDDGLEAIGAYAFAYCKALRIVDLPNLQSVGYQAFYATDSLDFLTLPRVTTMDSRAFDHQAAGNQNLVLSLPSLPETKAYDFWLNMKTLRLDSATKIATNSIRQCRTLKYLYLLSAQTIESSAFSISNAIIALVLGGDAVCTLGSVDTLSSTPIGSGTGYIYVPRALVDSYKAATNWSTYANQFRALEDYTVDGTITGDLDETKI